MSVGDSKGTDAVSRIDHSKLQHATAVCDKLFLLKKLGQVAVVGCFSVSGTIVKGYFGGGFFLPFVGLSSVGVRVGKIGKSDENPHFFTL